MDLSPEELLHRKEMLKQFGNFIENATDTLSIFCEQLGWSLDKTPTDGEALVECPINSEHRVLPSKLDDHCQTCTLKHNGYDSTHSLYPSYNSSTSLGQTIKIDKSAQMQILKSAHEGSNFVLNMIKECLVQDILQYFHNELQNKKISYIKPDFREVSQSLERYVCDFTPDERRILYDNAVKNTKLPNHDNIRNDLTEIDVFNKTDVKPKTELELLQEQRDLKRRRAAYRGKRVHTDRKSYVEVLREVVEGLTNSLSQQDDKSMHATKTTNSITESVSNNRIVYKYAGNRNNGDNPYTRWLNIKMEESKLFKYSEKNSGSLYQEASTSRSHCSKDKTDIKKSRKSRSKSRERWRSSNEIKLMRLRRSRSRSRFKETEYTRSKRSRTPLKFNETKYKRSKSKEIEYTRSKRSRTPLKFNETKYKRSKSKETIYKKSKSRSVSIERKHKKSKKSKTRSKSKEIKSRQSRSQSPFIENKHKSSKRCRTRSKSKEFSLRKKNERSKSPIYYSKLPLLNENDTTVKFKSNDNHKKKSKHKKKRKHSKSPKKSHKSKKSNDIEVYENFDDKISKDINIPSTSHKSR